MMTKRILLIALMVLLTSVATHAQTDSTWETWVFVEYTDTEGGLTGEGEIYTITAEGVTNVRPVPTGFIEPNTFGGQTVISPDGRYLARVTARNATSTITIADLQENTCCTLVPQTEAIWAYALGQFSPDSTQLVFSFVSPGEGEGGFPPVGGIRIVDVASGQIVNELLTTEFTGIPNGEFASWAALDSWTERGIAFTPNCYACEGFFRAQFSIWNPTTGDITPQSGIYAGINITQLPATGEVVATFIDDRWPSKPIFGMLPPGNVVGYYPNGGMPDFEGRGEPVIFFDRQDLEIDRVTWVDDGRSLVTAPYNNQASIWQVINRDGSIIDVAIPQDVALLTGTRDGFLAIREISFGSEAIFAWTSGAADLQQIGQIGTGSFRKTIIYNTPLGETLGDNPQQFPLISGPSAQEYAAIWQSVAYTCEGFLPSRLVRNQFGRVTPGAPNNMRNGPFAADEPPIGQIPAGEQFYVLNGPFCDGNGSAWWEVDYNGLIGFTAEGEGNTYWTEPVAP